MVLYDFDHCSLIVTPIFNTLCHFGPTRIQGGHSRARKGTEVTASTRGTTKYTIFLQPIKRQLQRDMIKSSEVY